MEKTAEIKGYTAEEVAEANMKWLQSEVEE